MQNDTVDDLLAYFNRKNANHKAKMVYASMKLNMRFGSRKRYNHPHIPIMINKNIFAQLEQSWPDEYALTSRNLVVNQKYFLCVFTFYLHPN